MNEEMNRLDPSQQSAALKRLAEHLARLNAQAGSNLNMENDMLSLIVSGTLNGEDISRQYPAFHRKLLESPELRAAFLDALESIEAERSGELPPIPSPQTSLEFLHRPQVSPVIEILNQGTWRATWERTLEQLQAIFSPPELAYRADPSLSDDPWFTLLREEMKAEDTTYDVILDCTLSTENEEALSPILNLAVTLGATAQPAGFPLHASLQWGDYHESVLIADEGRVRFPDIPLAAVFDQIDSQPKAGLKLTLETAS